MSRRSLIRGTIGIGLLWAAAGHAEPNGPSAPASGTRTAETVATAGEPRGLIAIAERMAHYKVPGLSVAVIDNHRIVWARGYGVRSEGGGPVDTATLFQAASMSKPVAAAVALTLADAGRIGLDKPVNDSLKRWQLPSSPVAPASAVTLRHLLSHSGGLTVHGFAGYPAGAVVPTVPQLLDGQAPANSEAVRIDLTPGTKMRYSGGGSTVGQLMVEDVTGRRFADIADELVLKRVGMGPAGFYQPLPENRAANAAVGHTADGRAIAGRWHTYPELAAAGLWATPSDLARFLIAVSRASAGATDSGIRPNVARLLGEPQPGLVTDDGGMGLGFFTMGEGRARRIAHSGGNAGFRGYMVIFPETGQGVVVMVNGDGGGKIRGELIRSIAAAYGWPHPVF